MKNLKILVIAMVTVISFNACSLPDSKPENEEEVITTVTTTLTSGGEIITLQARDLDGYGPNEPVVTISGNLKAATSYTGAVTFLNETTNPVRNITTEIVTEGVDHQLFFQAPSAIGAIAYADQDANGKPIGLAFTLITGTATTGNLSITLKHLPAKSAIGVATGNITNAGGATDAAVSYPIVVE